MLIEIPDDVFEAAASLRVPLEGESHEQFISRVTTEMVAQLEQCYAVQLAERERRQIADFGRRIGRLPESERLKVQQIVGSEIPKVRLVR